MTRGSADGQRVYTRGRVLQVTPHAFAEGIRLMSEAIRCRFGPVAAVIGIANGGTIPAAALADVLPVPLYSVSARHNLTDAIRSEATGQVRADVTDLASDLAGQLLIGQVLLADDICGTGATFRAVIPDLAPHLGQGAVIRTVTLCRNTGSAVDPDLWLWDADDWVRFPWEPDLPPGTAAENLSAPPEVLPR